MMMPPTPTVAMGTHNGRTRRQRNVLGTLLVVALTGVLTACGATTGAHTSVTPTAEATQPPALPKGWSLVTSPSVGQEGRLIGVAARSSTDAWAVGQYQGTDSLQRTLIEHWDGSQWSVTPSPSPGAQANELVATAVVPGGDSVWAVGSQTTANGAQQPLVERWSGGEWSVASLPRLKVGGVLGGVVATSASDAWVVGSMHTSGSGQGAPSPDQPLALHWDGSQWKVVSVPSPSRDSEETLAAVAVLAPNDAWAVGSDTSNATSLIEHWDGARWKIVPGVGSGRVGFGLGGIAAVSPHDIWAVGMGRPPGFPLGCGAPSGALIVHWDGSRWSSVPVPQIGNRQTPDQYQLASVAASAANDVWAVGSVLDYETARSGAYLPVIEHWDGARWSVVSGPATPTTEGLMGVAAAGGAVWATGQSEASSGPGATLIAQWNGTRWGVVDSPSPGTLRNRLSGVAAVSASDAWAVGASAGGTLAERWSGGVWSVVSTPNTTPVDDSLEAVAAVSANDAWAVGVAGTSQGKVQATTQHWNGSDWSAVPAAPGDGTASVELSSVAALSASDVWAGGRGAVGPTLEHWTGSAWTLAPSPTSLDGMSISGFAINGLAPVAANDVWAVGGNVLYNCGSAFPALIEHWDGHTWKAIRNTPQGTLYGVTAVSATDVWAVGWSFGGGPNAALIMHWDGRAWKVVPAPMGLPGESARLTGVAAHGARDVWAVGNAYTVGTSVGEPQQVAAAAHWDGTHWSYAQLPQPGLNENSLAGVAPVVSGEFWAVGAYSNCAVCQAEQALILHFGP